MMLKKLCFATFLLVSSTVVMAGFVGPGGSMPIRTVAEAEKANDDEQVMLEGYIVRQLDDDEHYIFKDESGEIEIEIDEDVFQGRYVSPTTKIRILGEMDKGFFSGTVVDVDIMEIIN